MSAFHLMTTSVRLVKYKHRSLSFERRWQGHRHSVRHRKVHLSMCWMSVLSHCYDILGEPTHVIDPTRKLSRLAKRQASEHSWTQGNTGLRLTCFGSLNTEILNTSVIIFKILCGGSGFLSNTCGTLNTCHGRYLLLHLPVTAVFSSQYCWGKGTTEVRSFLLCWYIVAMVWIGFKFVHQGFIAQGAVLRLAMGQW